MMNKVRVRTVVAKPRSGKTIRIPYWIVDSRKEGPSLLIIAAQHGNELQGIETIRRFVEICRTAKMTGKVFAVPFGNLPAIRHGRPHINLGPEQRYEDDHGHNMNRTWPGRKNGNDTERVSYAIYKAFGGKTTHVLDLHTWERDHAQAVLAVDTPEVRKLSAKVGHRFVYFSANPHKGMLANVYCSTGRVGLTFEFTGQYDVYEEEVRRGLQVVLNFADAIGLLHGVSVKRDKPVIYSGRRESVVLRAPCNGLYVRSPHRLCDRVEKGAVLGHILSDKDLSCVAIKTPKAGWLRHYGPGRPGCDVSLKQLHAYVRRGEVLAVVSWPTDRY